MLELAVITTLLCLLQSHLQSSADLESFDFIYNVLQSVAIREGSQYTAQAWSQACFHHREVSNSHLQDDKSWPSFASASACESILQSFDDLNMYVVLLMACCFFVRRGC